MSLWEKDWDNPDDAVYDAPRFKADKGSREKAMQRYLELSQQLEDELIAEMGQEAYEASQHWINNPLIKPVSKVAMFEEWEERIRKEQNGRIIELLDDWKCGHPDCDGDKTEVCYPKHYLIQRIEGENK